MLCGGHIARAHTKQLTEFARQKLFQYVTKTHIRSSLLLPLQNAVVQKDIPKSVAAFLNHFTWSKNNFFYCLLQAETDPEGFASSLNILGTHSWEGGQCGFHSLKSCTSGECGNEVMCEGEDYHIENPLTCPFHKLAYQIEFYNRACQASQIIHTKLGHGHSNYPEASHNVSTRFRAKDKYSQ